MRQLIELLSWTSGFVVVAAVSAVLALITGRLQPAALRWAACTLSPSQFLTACTGLLFGSALTAPSPSIRLGLASFCFPGRSWASWRQSQSQLASVSTSRLSMSKTHNPPLQRDALPAIPARAPELPR